MLTESKHIPSEYTELLMQVQQTEANIDIDSDLTVFPPEHRDVFINSRTTIFPILGRRTGTLILGRVKDDFNENDLVLANTLQLLLVWKFYVRNIMKLRKKHVIKLLLQWQSIHYLILKKKRLNIFLRTWW